jgi:hypothetical protein
MRVWWLLLCIAGCSPYDYAKQVTDFSSGVDRVSASFNAASAQLATDRATEVQLELIDARAKVSTTGTCDEEISKTNLGSDAPCELYRTGGEPSQPSQTEQDLKKYKGTMTALVDYSHALAAVTNAADRSAYDAAVAKLATALQGIASVPGVQGVVAGKVVAAAVNLVGWVVGTALDEQRFESLKVAVNMVGTKPPDGDSPMKIITDAIGKGLAAARRDRLDILNNELEADRKQLGPSLTDSAYRGRLDEAEALIADIQTLRETDPKGTTDALNAAHEALVKAVDDPSANLPALVKALTAFSEKAEALQTAFAAPAKPKAAAATPKATSAKKGT